MEQSKSWQAGQLILEEQPSLYTLSGTSDGTHCNFCLKHLEAAKQSLLSSYRCKSCMHAKYCSVECQNQDWQGIHKFVCAPVRLLLNDDYHASDLTLLLLRLTAKMVHSPASMDAVCSLSTPAFEERLNAMQQDDGLVEKMPISWTALLNYLQLDDEQKRVAASVDFVDIFARVKHFAVPIMGGDLTPIGLGIYLKASTIEHSCAPNACLTYVGKGVRVMALENIENIDQVRISYLDILHPLEVRQKLLKDFHVECSCVLCADPAKDAERFSMPCVNKECDAEIPSDQRANLPCGKCGSEPTNNRHEEFRKVSAELDKAKISSAASPKIATFEPEADRQEEFRRMYGVFRGLMGECLLEDISPFDGIRVWDLEEKLLPVFHPKNPLWAPCWVKSALGLRIMWANEWAGSVGKALELYRTFLSPMDPLIGWCALWSSHHKISSRAESAAKLEEASRVFSAMLGEEHNLTIVAKINKAKLDAIRDAPRQKRGTRARNHQRRRDYF